MEDETRYYQLPYYGNNFDCYSFSANSFIAFIGISGRPEKPIDANFKVYINIFHTRGYIA
jgi:hypothetical protein